MVAKVQESCGHVSARRWLSKRMRNVSCLERASSSWRAAPSGPRPAVLVDPAEGSSASAARAGATAPRPARCCSTR
jgi:hypothetical protein